jgi:hypothetical protein
MRSAVLTSGGREASTIRLGDELTLTVEFAAPDPIRHPRIGLAICDEQGSPLISANNRYQPCEELDAPCTEGVITCRLGQVPLMPGKYLVTLRLGDFVYDTHVEENVLLFEVVEHDAWGLGRIPIRTASKLWWPTRFRIEAGIAPRGEPALPCAPAGGPTAVAPSRS